MIVGHENFAAFIDGGCPQCGHHLMFLDTDGEGLWWFQCDDHAHCNLSIKVQEEEDITQEILKDRFNGI